MGAEDVVTAAKLRFEAEVRAAERRYMDRVGALIHPDDGFHLSRWALVRHLRQRGLKFREIGKLLNVTAQQARALYMKSQRSYEDNDR